MCVHICIHLKLQCSSLIIKYLFIFKEESKHSPMHIIKIKIKSKSKFCKNFIIYTVNFENNFETHFRLILFIIQNINNSIILIEAHFKVYICGDLILQIAMEKIQFCNKKNKLIGLIIFHRMSNRTKFDLQKCSI